MGKLDNKVAIITGGARGIGKATAEIFTAEGAKVIIWDMLEVGEQTALELREKGFSVEFMKLSVTDVPAIEAATRDIFERYGHIDILVNNAGITRDKSLLKMSYQEWQLVIDINLNGVFNCTKTVVPYMIEGKFGRIICTSSVVGQMGNFGQTNYVATKAAIIGMVKTWAKELGKYGITANAVAPGFIKTDMTDMIPDDVKQQQIDAIPVKRLGEPADIANAYLFLASAEASYINGHTLSVNGGVA
jgi:3-oxoacyl-[acyl-carrier protein] reductase